MKLEQVSDQVWSLKTWVGIPIRVWLVTSKTEGVTLIDAGISMMADPIKRAVQIGCGPITRIVLTHGHSDHVGALLKLTKTPEFKDVPVYAHEIELPYMEGDLVYPRRKKPASGSLRGIAQPLPYDEEGKLAKIGGLRPYFTPGHSPGHTVYYHESDNILLAGDLFTSRSGKLRRPIAMFTGDMEEAVRSGKVITTLNPARMEICHGEPVFKPADDWEAYERRWQEKQREKVNINR